MIVNNLIVAIALTMCTRVQTHNGSTILIPKYAKVAHWGAGAAPQTAGESRSGQTLWTHRADANIAAGQNLRPRKPNRTQLHTAAAAAIGEVVQERFNPRPYFDYAQVPPRGQTAPPAPVLSKPDLYTSPYSSYNPPPSSPQPPDDTFPLDSPAPPSSPDGDSYDAPPPADAEAPYGYNKAPPKVPHQPTLGPPLASHADDHVFYPPGGHETILDHPPPGYEEPNGMGHDMGEHDLNPPPSGLTDARFPQYLYSDHHFDDHFGHHHIYKEVTTTTTTTPAPEDERVNKAHYSYYYLGRKLWYIPLYFSVYFIVYVTVLILKSIARHKIQFKEHVHFDREARKMDGTIDDLHKNVTTAVDLVNKKFNYIM